MAAEPHLTAERPFPGLRPFGSADREYFFGREDQVYSLYRLLDLSRFIAVIGSSGSGKSSLVRAGLLPLTEDEAAGSGGRDWRSTTFRPGDSPLGRLTDALTALIPESETEGPADRAIRRSRIEFALRRSSFGLSEALAEIPSLDDKPLLIVVDQFEELFRYAATASSMEERVSDSLWRDEAANFVQLLLEVSRDRARAVTVLLTMRSDFIGDCAIFQGLPEAVSAAQFLVPSLTRDQREDVIKKPVEKAGASIEPALVERLLNDAGSELDQLPVLQHALLRLWDRAGKDAKPGEPRHLTLAHYKKIGGIAGALSQHANEILHQLPGLELVVEQVFRALSATDKEGRATRRALPYAQLLAETGVSDDQLRQVLDRFRADDCSFIVPSIAADPVLRDDTRIDVVHEALLRRWDRISAPASEGVGGKAREGWLASEDRDGRYYRALLTLLEGEPVAEKLTLPLAQVDERSKWWTARPRTDAWAERYGGKLARVNQLFADSLAALAAEKAREALAKQHEREEERRKIEAAEAEKRTRLEHQAAVDRMRAEAAQRLTHRTRVAALAMLGVAILALGLGAYAWQQRTYAVSTAQRLQSTLDALQVAQRNMQVAEAGRRDAIQLQLKAERSRRLAETERLKETQALQHQTAAALEQAQAAKRETEIALQQANAALQEATRQRHIAEHQTQVAVAATTDAIKRRAALFSQAGREALLNGDDDNAAVLLAAAYGDDAQSPATRLTLAQALQKVGLRAGSFQAHDGLITVMQFNPKNPSQIATAGADGVKLWDPSGRLLHVFNDQSDLITSLAFDPSGRYLATAARDGTAKIRDLRGLKRNFAAPPIALTGHLRRINSIAFSHDGTRVVTASGDGTVKVWTTATGQEVPLDWPKGNDPINAAVFAPGDRTIVTVSSDGSLRVLDAATGKLSLAPIQSSTKSPLVRLAVASDGTHVLAAAGAADGGVLIYDIDANRLIKERHDHAGGVNALAFDPAGRRIVTASDDGTARVLDAQSGEQIATLAVKTGAGGTTALTSAVMNAVFSPSGGIIATTYKDGTVALWTSDGAVLARLGGPKGETVAAAFAPGGDILASGGSDGKVFLWRANALERADSPHKDAIESIVFAGDGKRMLTASRDGTAALWRLGDQLTRERTFAHTPETAWVTAANFSADGKRIVTAGGAQVKIWNAGSPSGTPPLAIIVPTAPQKRFSDALFVGDGDNVMVAQRGINEARSYYDYDKWIEWSADGKQRLVDEPSWQRDISQLQLSRNGHFALAVSSTGYTTFSWIDARYTYDSWGSVTHAMLANQHFFYALGLADGTIDIESLTGVKLKQFEAHQGRVSALSFSADDRWLGSAGSGDLVGKVWDMTTGRLHATLVGHTAEIGSIAFSPKGGALVLTTSADGTAKLWDRDTGDLLASNSVPGSKVSAASFTPDGADVVLGAADGDVQVWHLGRALPTPAKAAKDALATVERGGANSTNPLLHQAEDEVTLVAGATTEMARRADADRERVALRAATTNEPTRAADDLLPAFIATPSDPSLRFAVAALSSRFAALRATLSANSERIEHVAFAANGTRLVTTSFDKTARVWDPKSGRLLRTLSGFDSIVAFLAPQPHGNLVAVAALGDQSARVWNVDTGQVRYLPMHSAVRKVAFSGDGAHIVGYGQDGIVRIWRTADCEQIRTFSGPAVVGISPSTDGDVVAVAGTDLHVLLDQVHSGKRLATIDVSSTGDHTSISLVQLHPTLPLVLTTQKNVVRIWTRNGRLVRTLQYPKAMNWAGFGRQSDIVAATGTAGPILWRGERGTTLVRTGLSEGDRFGVFADGDRKFFSVGSGRSVAMWDAQGGRLLAEFPGADSDYVDADVSGDGALLATAGNDGLTHVWQTRAGAPAGVRFEAGAPVAGLQIDAAGRRLVTRAADGGTRLWDVASGRVLWTRTFVSSAGAPQVHITADGARVVVLMRLPPATGPPTFRVAVLDAADAREARHYDIAGDVDTSPTGRYVAWRNGAQISVLDALTGRRTGWAAAGTGRATFGSSDNVLVTADLAGLTTVWRRDGGRVMSISGAKGTVGTAQTLDGRRLLTFGPGIDTTLWDLAGPQPASLAILIGGDVSSAEFSADGTRILTTAVDGTLRVWSARGAPLAVLGGATHLTSGRFSADGRFVVAVADNGELSVWDEHGAELVTFPTRSELPVLSQSLGSLKMFAADESGVMLYDVGLAPTTEDARVLVRRLHVEASHSDTIASVRR